MKNLISNHFVDDVPANNAIWFIGDSLLTDAAGYYSHFKRKKCDGREGAAAGQDQILYMESMYSTKMVPTGIYTAHQAKNMPNIILNNLVDTLNIKAKVPHSIVIVINDHRFWNNTDLLTYQMDRIVNRFFKEIRRIVEARNLSLPPRAVNWDYPRLFITRALPLPNNMSKPYPKGFKANRRRYNRVLTRSECDLNYRSINLAEFTCDNLNGLFSHDGSLTQAGYKSFWMSISDAVHKADNSDHILMNKIRAKQIASQISLTSSDVQNAATNRNTSDISDVETMDNTSTQGPSPQNKQNEKSAKRKLLKEFNKQRPRSQDNKNSPMSESSEISEYFTSHHRTSWSNHTNHHNPKNPGRIVYGLNKEGRQKKKINKSNWRQRPAAW